MKALNRALAETVVSASLCASSTRHQTACFHSTYKREKEREREREREREKERERKRERGRERKRVREKES